MGLNPNLTRIAVTPDGGGEITFLERNITPFGFGGSGKIDDTSSGSTAEASGKVIKEFLPGDYIEITDGAMTVKYDPSQEAAILAALKVAGTIVVTFNDASLNTYTNAWIDTFTAQGVETVDNEQVWLADITLMSGGGTSGKPSHTP